MVQIFHFVPIAHSWVNRAEKGSGMHSASLLASRELCLIFVTIFFTQLSSPGQKAVWRAMQIYPFRFHFLHLVWICKILWYELNLSFYYTFVWIGVSTIGEQKKRVKRIYLQIREKSRSFPFESSMRGEKERGEKKVERDLKKLKLASWNAMVGTCLVANWRLVFMPPSFMLLVNGIFVVGDQNAPEWVPAPISPFTINRPENVKLIVCGRREWNKSVKEYLKNRMWQIGRKSPLCPRYNSRAKNLPLATHE